MSKNKHTLAQRLGSALLAGGLTLASGQAAADLDLAQKPLFVSAGAEPNVMILLDDSGSMGNWVSSESKRRIEIAKEVATELVSSTEGMRFGLTTFNGNHGGNLRAECGADTAELVSAIEGVSANGNTPLAESYYEITRYFRGMKPYDFKHDKVDSDASEYTSPLQYRCQRNFIVAITDGEPTYDNTFPHNDPVDVADTERSLPDWMSFSEDGVANDDEYIDDLAKFAYDLDLKGKDDLDDAGVSFDDNGGRFSQQNIGTYTVGVFGHGGASLKSAAEQGDGTYYTADDTEELTSSLQSAMSAILDQSTASAAIATNSTRLDTNTLIYQARFSTTDWSGELRAFPITEDGSLDDQSWEASEKIPDLREIFTWKPALKNNETSQGVSFHWGNLNDDQQTALNTNIEGTVDNKGSRRVTYLRGDSNDTDFRTRSSLLGDIINSNPLFVGDANYRFDLLPEAIGSNQDPDAATNTYIAYRTSDAYLNRTKMLYVGANDGMLHAFNATTGEEMFAYVPNAVYGHLSDLTSPDYEHRAYVDGSPRASDAWIKGNGVTEAWHTVLLGTLGAGGRAVFALDVTNPDTFDTGDVLWEFEHADLGYTYGQATVARLASGDWVALVGNGYNSNNHKAVLFVLNLSTGAVLKAIDTGVGSSANPNGLSSPVPVDTDGDRITDHVYAGDLHGNLWKFDLSGNNSNGWGIAFGNKNNPEPLFTAVDGNSRAQPITVRPTVGGHADGGVMVYFGTGKYLENQDARLNAGDPVNSLYGLHDKGVQITGRDKLQKQSIIAEVNRTFEGENEAKHNYDLRVVSQNKAPDTAKGWYLDLLSPGSTATGERVISDAVVRNGRLIVSTMIPSTDPCGFGGDSWLMEIDAMSGGRLNQTPFDLNRDNRFSDSDYVTITIPGENEGDDDKEIRVPVSGKKSKEGITGKPAIISADDREYKFTSGTSGEIEVTVESGGVSTGRQSWRQLR